MSAKSEMRWVVLKFGGSSVARADNWPRILEIVRQRVAEGFRPLIVHSALAGVSDALAELVRNPAATTDGGGGLAAIEARHLQFADEIDIDGEPLIAPMIERVGDVLGEIRKASPRHEASPRQEAEVMAAGELMATAISAAWLQGRLGGQVEGAGQGRSQEMAVTLLDARDLLVSEDGSDLPDHVRILSATCSFAPDEELSARLTARLGNGPGIILTQGFIARGADGETVLLGRGGSDTSAAYLAAKLSAERLEIWTDVPGMFSADPRVVPGARLLRQLKYEEAQEIASMGAAVLHPRCIAPVRQGGIPVHVRCTSRPELAGTLIAADAGDDAPRVKAISSRAGAVLISMETFGMWHQVGFLAEAFAVFSRLGLSIDLVSTSESNVTVTLDGDATTSAGDVLDRLRTELEKICRVRILENVAVVSLIGRKIRALLHEIGPALEVFEEHPIHLVSQAASDLNLCFVVESDQAERLIKKLHSTLIRPNAGEALFGPTTEEIERQTPGGVAPREYPSKPWWADKRSQLLEIAAARTSAYVYDAASIAAAADRLAAIANVDRVFYAMKANGHADVLRQVHDAGLGIECVSPGEIARVLELFPDIDRGRILFTPNFAPRDEYETGLAAGVHITLDNLYPLAEWGEIFAGRDVLLRVDTGTGRGHHRHVRTAGALSKFGIPLDELGEAAELVGRAGARVVGLHAHAGSGILQPGNWLELGQILVEATGQFPDAGILNLGGGLGVPERPGDAPLDLDALGRCLGEIKSARPDIELWLEPGRYLVAEAGVLLTRVTQTKGKGAQRYVGVSTGMNSLIRPALYGAYHEIVNLTRLDEVGRELATIVGPICESADKLGTDRLLPPCAEGDVLLVATAGAYGAVMASSYNMREPAPEVTI